MNRIYKDEEKVAISAELESLVIMWTDFEGDFEGFFENSQNRLKSLCRLLQVAKIEISLSAPRTVLSPDGLEDSKVLYKSEKEPAATPVVITKDTYEGGSCICKFYPYSGQEFDSFVKSRLEFLSTLIYSYGGRVRTRAMLKHAISSDMMTGLPNLKSFLAFLGMLMHKGIASQYNAYYINVRNFKYVNKLSDQQSGDASMIQYAQRLAALADKDEIVGRLGGDNFVALIKREENDSFLEGIKGIPVDVTTKSGLRTVELSAVSGVYEIPEDIKNPIDVMMPIAVAHQLAKQVLHKDYVFYTDALAKQLMGGQRVLVNFISALSQHEFEAYLQPKVDINTEKVCGAEALARWNHKGETMSPAEFIPPLERDGSICRLDFEMLRQTCEIISGWIKAGIKPVKISVNLSRWHLEEPKTADRIIEIVSKYDFDPALLEFEITESVDFREFEALTKLLSQLQKYGFTTSIDDFGTGYSSITMLKDFNLDVLKLDRSFIDKIGDETEGAKDRILVSSVVSLAKQLDMAVLAEGVETKEQKEYLKEINCDMIQGFYYSKPIKASEFTEKYMVK